MNDDDHADQPEPDLDFDTEVARLNIEEALHGRFQAVEAASGQGIERWQSIVSSGGTKYLVLDVYLEGDSVGVRAIRYDLGPDACPIAEGLDEGSTPVYDLGTDWRVERGRLHPDR